MPTYIKCDFPARFAENNPAPATLYLDPQVIERLKAREAERNKLRQQGGPAADKAQDLSIEQITSWIAFSSVNLTEGARAQAEVVVGQLEIKPGMLTLTYRVKSLSGWSGEKNTTLMIGAWLDAVKSGALPVKKLELMSDKLPLEPSQPLRSPTGLFDRVSEQVLPWDAFQTQAPQTHLAVQPFVPLLHRLRSFEEQATYVYAPKPNEPLPGGIESRSQQLEREIAALQEYDREFCGKKEKRARNPQEHYQLYLGLLARIEAIQEKYAEALAGSDYKAQAETLEGHRQKLAALDEAITVDNEGLKRGFEELNGIYADQEWTKKVTDNLSTLSTRFYQEYASALITAYESKRKEIQYTSTAESANMAAGLNTIGDLNGILNRIASEIVKFYAGGTEGSSLLNSHFQDMHGLTATSGNEGNTRASLAAVSAATTKKLLPPGFTLSFGDKLPTDSPSIPGDKKIQAYHRVVDAAGLSATTLDDLFEYAQFLRQRGKLQRKRAWNEFTCPTELDLAPLANRLEEILQVLLASIANNGYQKHLSDVQGMLSSVRKKVKSAKETIQTIQDKITAFTQKHIIGQINLQKMVDEVNAIEQRLKPPSPSSVVGSTTSGGTASSAPQESTQLNYTEALQTTQARLRSLQAHYSPARGFGLWGNDGLNDKQDVVKVLLEWAERLKSGQPELDKELEQLWNATTLLVNTHRYAKLDWLRSVFSCGGCCTMRTAGAKVWIPEEGDAAVRDESTLGRLNRCLDEKMDESTVSVTLDAETSVSSFDDLVRHLNKIKQKNQPPAMPPGTATAGAQNTRPRANAMTGAQRQQPPRF